MDYSPPGSTVPGISQARLMEWVAISFSRFRNEQTVSINSKIANIYWLFTSLEHAVLNALYGYQGRSQASWEWGYNLFSAYFCSTYELQWFLKVIKEVHKEKYTIDMTVAPKPKNLLSSPYRKFTNISQRGWQRVTSLQKRCQGHKWAERLAHHPTVAESQQWDSADKNKTVFIYNSTNSRNITWCVPLPLKPTDTMGPDCARAGGYAAAEESRIHGSPLIVRVNKPRSQ